MAGKATGTMPSISPARSFQSYGFTLSAWTRTRTSPGPACG